MISAVVVDNGEPLLEKCLESLRDQTERVEIIVVGGDKTDYELAKSLADEVYGPITTSIGDARVYGILKANGEVILSCDSDTIYLPNYAETAMRELQKRGFVRAGTILPHKPNPLGLWEIKYLYPIVPYEHTLAFRKSAFISHGLHEIKFRLKREDLAVHLAWRGMLIPPIKEMVLRTRVPTKFVENCSKLIPSATIASLPITAISSMLLAKTFLKL